MSTGVGPVLLIGANGMLGRAWCRLLDHRGIEYCATTRQALDIADNTAVRRFVQPIYPIVVNCAAWTDVDAAETQSSAADRINGTAVGQLADRCAVTGSLLVHYSTDYVFDGQGRSPYPSDYPAHPINAYGRSKLLGESLIQRSGCRNLLVRTSWLYAPWGRNFVRTMAKLATERDVLRVVNDQRGRPTSAEHLASATLGLLELNAAGTYHVTGGGECTWYELAHEVAHQVNPRCRVEPCASDEFPRPAKRPAYSVLDLSATESLLGPSPHWKENVAKSLASGVQLALGVQA